MFKTKEIIMKIKSHAFALVFITLVVKTDTAPAKVVTAFHQALESGDKAKVRSLQADDVLIFEGGVEHSADQYSNHHMLADMKISRCG